MAASKPLIFSSIAISDAGANTNSISYTTHEVDSRELGIEDVETMVDDGQTLIDAYDGSIVVHVFDDAVMSDAHVQSNSTPVAACRITFTGASGASTVVFDNVRVSARQDFTLNRVSYRLRATKRTTAQPFTVS